MLAQTLMTEPDDTFDLDAYFRRIGYAGARAPSRATLDALHLAHATHIPFENLDILLGRPIRLDLASLQAKLVAGRRGGYCFEQNRLFATVLETLGFAVTPLAARVRFGTTSILPRTHMTLQVEVDGDRVLADVGFGIHGLLLPVSLAQAAEARQFAWTYRVAEDAGLRVLQLRTGGAWIDLYAFTLERHFAVDYEMANHYTSTHPASPFMNRILMRALTDDGRVTVMNRDATIWRGNTPHKFELEDRRALRGLLLEYFGVDLPEVEHMRVPGVAEWA